MGFQERVHGSFMARFGEDSPESSWPPVHRDDAQAAPDGMGVGRPDTGTTRPDTALSSRPPSQPQFQNMHKESNLQSGAGFSSPDKDQPLPAIDLRGPVRGVCPYELAKRRLRQTGISSVHRLPFGVELPNVPAAKKKWNTKHQLLPGDNEQKPPGVRNYFSVQETEDELRYTLSRSRRPGTSSLIKSLSQPELRKGDKGHPLTTSVLHCDADISLCANRHRPDGTMYDRDGKGHGWNPRFNVGTVNMGHLMYATQRGYFGKPCTFGKTESQAWRRENDYEIRPGVWRSDDTMGQSRLGPLGSLEPLDPYSTMRSVC